MPFANPWQLPPALLPGTAHCRQAIGRPSEVYIHVRLARLILIRYDSSRRRGRHCRLRAFPAGPQSGPVSGHAPARGAKVYEGNRGIYPGKYEVTGDRAQLILTTH